MKAQRIGHEDTLPGLHGMHVADWDPVSVDLLARLRFIALNCRASARLELGAIARTGGSPDPEPLCPAETLVRGLTQALGRMPRFYRPGVEEVSSDEAWLLRSVTSDRNGDRDSLEFLMRSRVVPPARRNLRYLIANVVPKSDAA